MLYFKGWKRGTKSINRIVLSSLICIIAACNNIGGKRAASVDDSLFSDINRFNSELNLLSDVDRVAFTSDKILREYYAGGGHLLWMNKYGLYPVADTLLNELADLEKEGLSDDYFMVDSLSSLLAKIRVKDFSPANDTLPMLAAAEYNLTKTYLRYVTGMRYGFVNPKTILNRLDVDKKDNATGRVNKYKVLFDIDIDRPDSMFYATAIKSVDANLLGDFMREQRPKSDMYNRLCSLLADTTYTDKKRVLCNMERSRWRGASPMGDEDKYVVVNIPAYHLYAHAADTVLDMRIGCGTFRNKTPLLTGNISWMEVNPVWIIPKSIIENEVSPHAGDTAYFARNRYSVIEKATGDTINAELLTSRMLKSGKYKVVQKGGEGNSLGRIVFRFRNNMAIYLHDTSTKAFFKRERRGVSHGCVRVQKPFEFAEYLLDTDDEWLLDKLRISMDMEPETDKGKEFIEENEGDDLKLVKRLNVEPQVPLFIIYYTIYPNEHDELTTYPDVYEYDDILYEHIKPFV